MPDKKVVLLSDVLPTAWHATELGGVSKGDRVAIWGAGPGACALHASVAYCQCQWQWHCAQHPLLDQMCWCMPAGKMSIHARFGRLHVM